MNLPNDFNASAQTLLNEETDNVSIDRTAESNELLREGIAAAKAGDRNSARHDLLRATDLKPDNETAWLWLASISEQPAELLGFLDKVLEINPFNERALQWSRATRTLLAKSLLQRGATLVKEERREEAAKLFQEATTHDRENEMAWLWLASVASEPEDKLSYLQRVLNINPSNEKAQTSFNAVKRQIARSLLKKGSIAAVSGDLDVARSILTDVMDYADDIEDAWLLNAFLSESVSEKANSYRRALELNPNSKFAIEGLESLRSSRMTNGASSPELSAESPSSVLTETSTENEVEVPSPDFQNEDTTAEKESQEELLAKVFASTPNEEMTAAQEQTAKNDETVSAHSEYNVSQPAEEVSVKESQDENLDTAHYETEEFDTETAHNENEEIHVTNTENLETATEETYFDNGEETVYETAEDDVLGASVLGENISEETSKTAETSPAVQSQCFVCQTELVNGNTECGDCGMLFNLSNAELMLTHEGVNQSIVHTYIEGLLAEQSHRKLTAEEYKRLGIAHFNMRDPKRGSFCLQQSQKFGEFDETVERFLNSVSEIELAQNRLESGAGDGKTILVVDDSPTVRKLISVKLEKVGHRVITASDGLEALSKLNESIPDLILLDITMPRLDGYQLCKLVRGNAATRHIPVVMISGKDGFFDKVRGRMAGSTAYITKPFGPETLLETVQTYCFQK